VDLLGVNDVKVLEKIFEAGFVEFNMVHLKASFFRVLEPFGDS
jgi:hypothetical protein